jgi:hypothetical protein
LERGNAGTLKMRPDKFEENFYQGQSMRRRNGISGETVAFHGTDDRAVPNVSDWINYSRASDIRVSQTEKRRSMKRKLPFLLLFGLLIAGCYSSKFATYQSPCETGETWQVKVEKSGLYPTIKVIVNDSALITETVPFFDWKGINTTGTYRGHSVELIVTYNSGFLGIGSYYSAIVTIDNKFFVGQFRLPTINLGGD